MIAVAIAFGLGSWFAPAPMYEGMRVCAMRDRRLIGRRVRIQTATRSSSCVVIGTGPFAGGRVIDVSPLVRDDLNMLKSGVLRVRVLSP